MLNQGIPGFELPIQQVVMALTLIKGEKVNLWVKNMLDSLRRLHPVQHNVPAVWNHFKEAFWTKFTDSTRELRARGQLERLKFQYPDINGYIAEFEDLTVQAGYNIVSQETINLFLKGFNKNRSLLNKVFMPPVLVSYEAMKRRLIAIVKSMQLVNLIAQDTPDFRTFQPNRKPTTPAKLCTMTSNVVKCPTLDEQHTSTNGHEQLSLHSDVVHQAIPRKCDTSRTKPTNESTPTQVLQLWQSQSPSGPMPGPKES